DFLDAYPETVFDAFSQRRAALVRSNNYAHRVALKTSDSSATYARVRRQRYPTSNTDGSVRSLDPSLARDLRRGAKNEIRNAASKPARPNAKRNVVIRAELGRTVAQ